MTIRAVLDRIVRGCAVAASLGLAVVTALALAASAAGPAPGASTSSAAPPGKTSRGTRPVPSVTKPIAVTPGLDDSLRLDPAVRTEVLPNGIHVYIRKNGKPEARASLRLVVGVGSIAEADDQQGMAHFAEHMNFNGSAHFKPDEMVSYLRSIGLRFGADANAYTSFDETVYMLEVPTDRDSVLDRGLVALSDFAGRASLSDSEITRERGVVLEEWRLGQGVQERMQRKQLPVLYHGSRYAERVPIGKPEIIEKGPASRLRDFYRDWYTPDHMAVVAVGDFDPARMERLIRAHFADIPRGAPHVPPAAPIPPHRETLVSIATDREATGSWVTIFQKRPRDASARVRDYRAGLIDDLLEQVLDSRLDEMSHWERPPFLHAQTFGGDLGRSAEAFGLSASVADGGIERGLDALLTEVARLREHGVLAVELDRAKRETMAATEGEYAEREKTESARFAGAYASSFLTGDPEPGIEAEHTLTRALLPGITLEELNARISALVHEGDRVILAGAPEKPGLKAPSASDLQSVVTRVAASRVEAWADSTAGKRLMAQIPAPGKVTSRRVIPELGVTVLTLGNGVEVWLKPTDFKADEILFNAVALGGSSLADSSQYVASDLSSTIVDQSGVGGYSSVEIEKLLAGILADASPYVEDYLHGVSGSCRPQDLETALQLVHLTFTHPTESPKELATLKHRFHSYLLDRSNSPEAVFQDTVTAVNTRGFYMDRPLTLAAVDALALGPSLAFYRERFANAADFRFFFVGSFAVDSITPKVARYLGSLPSRGARTSNFVPRVPRFPDTKRTARVVKGSEPKSSTRITFFADTGLDELEMHRARAAASILGERLRQILREQLSATYGASVRYGDRLPAKGYGTMSIGFGGAPENVDRMVEATLREVERLKSEGPSADDVAKDQEIERRELETDSKRNGNWLGWLRTYTMLGWDPLRINARRERIDRLTAADLKETFRKYFPMDRYTVVTLVPAKVEGSAAKPGGE